MGQNKDMVALRFNYIKPKYVHIGCTTFTKQKTAREAEVPL